MSKGKVCLVISAVLYGIAPIFAKICYSGGANGITLTFLRASLSIPLLYVLMRINKTPMKLNRAELKSVVLLGVFGGAVPILLLYASYNFISIGLATTLHFVYPLVTVIASALLYREKIPMMKIAAAVLVTLGIFFFADIETAADTVGIALALLSGVFYSFYVIYIERSGLDEMNYAKLTFYVMLIMSASTACFGAVSGGLAFDMTGGAWIFAAVISLTVTLGAMPLFQAGVRYEGASTAGIVSTLEPIISVAFGVVFLGETLGAAQVVGMAMIIAGIMPVNR